MYHASLRGEFGLAWLGPRGIDMLKSFVLTGERCVDLKTNGSSQVIVGVLSRAELVAECFFLLLKPQMW